MKENSMFEDLKKLQMKLESLKKGHQEHRDNIKLEMKTALELNTLVEERQAVLNNV
jgi:hypothetical protein